MDCIKSNNERPYLFSFGGKPFSSVILFLIVVKSVVSCIERYKHFAELIECIQAIDEVQKVGPCHSQLFSLIPCMCMSHIVWQTVCVCVFALLFNCLKAISLLILCHC